MKTLICNAKGIIVLAPTDSQKIQKTRLAKSYINSESKKGPTFKNWPLVKNPHFLSNLYETW